VSAPRRVGPATITLRDGRVYIADRAEETRHRLSFTGRLRVRNLTGERLYAPRTLSVELRRVKRVDWQEGGP
jgi:hypothetical protein